MGALLLLTVLVISRARNTAVVNTIDHVLMTYRQTVKADTEYTAGGVGVNGIDNEIQRPQSFEAMEIDVLEEHVLVLNGMYAVPLDTEWVGDGCTLRRAGIENALYSSVTISDGRTPNQSIVPGGSDCNNATDFMDVLDALNTAVHPLLAAQIKDLDSATEADDSASDAGRISSAIVETDDAMYAAIDPGSEPVYSVLASAPHVNLNIGCGSSNTDDVRYAGYDAPPGANAGDDIIYATPLEGDGRPVASRVPNPIYVSATVNAHSPA